MEYKYLLRMSLWGIAVFCEINELVEKVSELNAYAITDKIFLRVNDNVRVKKDLILKWMGGALKDNAKFIYELTGGKVVCYSIEYLDVDFAYFQQEGLYCTMVGWLTKYYEYPFPPIPVTFNKIENRYEFQFPNVQ